MGFLSLRTSVPLAMLLFATGAFAQGVVDQQNDPSGGSGFGCGSPTPILNGTILQSFVPTADNLIAVELRLQAGSAFPSAGTTTTARIRDGSSSGTVLGQASASVAGPLSASTQVVVRFDFSTITLTPGNTYLIEWVTPPTTELMWVGQGNDPYPAGTAYSCSGNVWPVSGTDFNFVTYASAPEPTASEAPAADPPTCESLFEQLRAAVADLDLHRFKQRVLDRQLDCAEKHLAKGKAKAAAANVFALECQIRLLARLGVISADEADTVLGLAAAFRECLGVETKSKGHDGWGWGWHWKHDGHDD